MSDGDSTACDEREKTPSRRESAVADAVTSPPPDGGYGWVCLFAYFCGNAFTWGVVAVSNAELKQNEAY